MKNLRFGFLAALIVLVAHPAVAQVLGPVYPAPGNSHYSGGTYSGFNPSDYSQLWWVEVPLNVCSPSGCDGAAMQFASYTQSGSNGVAIWDSTQEWAIATATGTVYVPTEFELTLVGDPSILTGAEVTGAGLPTGLGFALPVTGNFEVTGAEFLACPTPTTCESATTYFDDLHTEGTGFQTSNSGEFFYTPTPEPNSVLLFGTGLLLIGEILRRRLA